MRGLLGEEACQILSDPENLQMSVTENCLVQVQSVFSWELDYKYMQWQVFLLQ